MVLWEELARGRSTSEALILSNAWCFDQRDTFASWSEFVVLTSVTVEHTPEERLDRYRSGRAVYASELL